MVIGDVLVPCEYYESTQTVDRVTCFSHNIVPCTLEKLRPGKSLTGRLQSSQFVLPKPPRTRAGNYGYCTERYPIVLERARAAAKAAGVV